ncbi:Kelch repeat-containing protein [Colletotrichum spinosum]|uniref:Kelch repeat-containing protein n=1 Tax=Colletotrichum spinosum TaxID=1347390 RepID=A0A4V3HRR2_9PEZI|nr:Kelch repeat-containing protein [Colletotrichum spinosum]
MGFSRVLTLVLAASALVSAVLDVRQASDGPTVIVTSGSPSVTATTPIFAAPTSEPAPNVNSSVYDLSQHFCRIWRHASVYAGGKIYIDGGNTYVPKGGKTFYNTGAEDWTPGMHTQLLVLDLSKNFTNQEAAPYSSVFKAPDVPNALIEHALWYSPATRKIYQLGGWFSFNGDSNPAYLADKRLPEPAIWEFDIDAERWSMSNDFNISNNGHAVDRPGAAAFCDAPSLNRSYILEGYTQRRTSPANAQYGSSSDFRFVEGLLELDTSQSRPQLTNISVPTYMGPRMNGAMVHVPVGDKGIIVSIGGQTTLDPTPYGVRIPKANELNVNTNLSFVDIYDIQTGLWFRQQTFGLPELPAGRSDVCAVAVPAADSSSYSIYVVAGVGNYATFSTTAEVWVLTLPTFQWVLVHARQDGGMYGHTCHAVGENLLLVGGMQTRNGRNADSCADHMPVEIFSLASLNYTGRFDAEAARRTAPVPARVVQVIGGTASGGAYVKGPRVWSDVYLQYIFDPSLARPQYTPSYTLVVQPSGVTSAAVTPSSEPEGSSRGFIVGGTVGGVLGFIALLGAGVFIILRRRKRRAAPAVPAAAAEVSQQRPFSELPGYTPYSSPEPKPPIAGSPTPPSPRFHAAELEVPPSASEMPSSPRYGASVEMGSDVTQSPRTGNMSPALGSEAQSGGRYGKYSPDR